MRRGLSTKASSGHPFGEILHDEHGGQAGQRGDAVVVVVVVMVTPPRNHHAPWNARPEARRRRIKVLLLSRLASSGMEKPDLFIEFGKRK